MGYAKVASVSKEKEKLSPICSRLLREIDLDVFFRATSSW